MATRSSRSGLVAVILGTFALGMSASMGCRAVITTQQQSPDTDSDLPSEVESDGDEKGKTVPDTSEKPNGRTEPQDQTPVKDAGLDTGAVVKDAGPDVVAPSVQTSTIADLFDATKTPNATPVAIRRMVVTAVGDYSTSSDGNPLPCVSTAIVQDPACTTPPCGMALRERGPLASCAGPILGLAKLPLGAVVDASGTFAIERTARYIDITTVTDTGAKGTVTPVAIADIATLADPTVFAKYLYTVVRAEVSPARVATRDLLGTFQAALISLADLREPALFDPLRVSPAVQGSLVSRVTGVPYYRLRSFLYLRIRQASDTVVQ